MFDGDSLRFVGGGSAMSNRKDVLIEVEEQFEQRLDYHSSYFTTYMYAYVDMPKRVTWTLGGAVVSYDDDFSGGIDIFKLLPKLGVRAEITDYLTVRAAYLKNLKPDLVSEQVLEPTSVAGFNQFYDTYNGSTLDQFGGAVDLKLGKNLRIGGEVINREFSIPRLGDTDGELEERSYGGYIYATFLEDFAFSAEIVHEHAESKNAVRDFADWRVTSVPLTLSYFSESGWFGSAGVEFVDHSFDDPGSGGEDTFNIVSATIGYRLPDNRGVISLEGQNLLDTDFSFQNRSIRYQLTLPPRYAPDLTIALRGTFSF
jgi:hypothetical protein